MQELYPTYAKERIVRLKRELSQIHDYYPQDFDEEFSLEWCRWLLGQKMIAYRHAELTKIKRKLKKMAFEAGILKKSGDELDLDVIHDVPIAELHHFEKKRDTFKGWAAICPFHKEKTPSFDVNTEENVWYCFGEAQGGDNIAFIMQLHDVDFKKACEIIKTYI